MYSYSRKGIYQEILGGIHLYFINKLLLHNNGESTRHTVHCITVEGIVDSIHFSN